MHKEKSKLLQCWAQDRGQVVSEVVFFTFRFGISLLPWLPALQCTLLGYSLLGAEWTKITISSLFQRVKLGRSLTWGCFSLWEREDKKKSSWWNFQERFTQDKGLKCLLWIGRAFQNALFHHVQQFSYLYTCPSHISLKSQDFQFLGSCAHTLKFCFVFQWLLNCLLGFFGSHLPFSSFASDSSITLGYP